MEGAKGNVFADRDWRRFSVKVVLKQRPKA